VGIHAEPGNSDVISCTTATSFGEHWRALEGLGLTQPNTFSPDGQTTYATTTNPDAEGCRLHALDVETGETRWCQTADPTIVQGAVEVDAAGDLYFTEDGSIVSMSAEGTPRWRTPMTDSEGEVDAPWGLHFTPGGHVATVTASGVVYLLDRADGSVLDALSIPDEWGFVGPAAMEIDFDLSDFLPEEVVEDIDTVWGETTDDGAADGFLSFLGSSFFCDNTAAVSARGDIYVIGGGPDENTGALVQILVEGTDEEPRLAPGWHTPTHAGSATSPSISRGDRWVVISDGASSDTFLDPDAVDARVKVMDIEACDANTDADPDPSVCGVAYEEPLERGPMMGAPAILDDGVVVFYELSLDWTAGPDARDMVALGPDGVIWEVSLPDDMDWTSVITVTDNHLIGTASRVELSDESLFTLNFPTVTEDSLVILDREDGSLVWSATIPDDSSATVTIGPDGELYVGVMGLLSLLAIDDRPDLGLVRFSPLPAE